MNELDAIYLWLSEAEENRAIFKSAGKFVAQNLGLADVIEEAEGETIGDAIRAWNEQYNPHISKRTVEK